MNAQPEEILDAQDRIMFLIASGPSYQELLAAFTARTSVSFTYRWVDSRDGWLEETHRVSVYLVEDPTPDAVIVVCIPENDYVESSEQILVGLYNFHENKEEGYTGEGGPHGYFNMVDHRHIALDILKLFSEKPLKA